jgi:Arc/MetJ-type ribon-helix-helix transcriptional regulator
MAQRIRRKRPAKAGRVRLNLTLPVQLAQILDSWIVAGRYDGASDYLRTKIRQEAGMDEAPKKGEGIP